MTDFIRLLPDPPRQNTLPHSYWRRLRSGGGIPLAEPWASVEEVAKHLGVAKDSVYRWIDHRGLPAHKIGRLWKFKLSEVDHWVRAGGADAQDGEKDTAQ
ncbi:Excisionase/Xis, DNA-binding domain protein [mine drainage metagenome]|uniref:Excisionase/Xis, DNA-binding domain protein n=1 Tax=mine drainage metagenome TaxID=410659 RepID=T0ZMT0_9ZZZZ